MTLLTGNSLSGKTTRLVDAFLQYVSGGKRPDEILCLSFFSANAAAIRHTLQPKIGAFLPWVTTVQRFQTLLLRQYATPARLPRRG